MKRLGAICIASIVVVLTFLPSCFATDYVSLYHYGQDISYCSTAKCKKGAANCEEDAYPCKLRDDNYLYKYAIHYTGWKDLYNLNDPKILCGTDYENLSSCNATEATLTFYLTSLQRPESPPDIDSFPEGFRLFIPPGTVYAGVTLYFPINAREGVVVRYKRPPDCSYCQYGGHPDEYDKVPWENDASTRLSDLAERDVYLPNGGGHASVLPAFSRTSPMSPEESGWLYIKKLPFGSSRIHDVKVTIRVNVNAYLDWYNSVIEGSGECMDSNNATDSGGHYCWDEAGDPWTQSGSGTTPPAWPLAAPGKPLDALPYGSNVNPGDTLVTVPPQQVLLQPLLKTMPEDVGREAKLLVYIYLPILHYGFTLQSPNIAALGSTIGFEELLPDAIDLRGHEGLVIDVYYGYVLVDGTIRYNAYEVQVQ